MKKNIFLLFVFLFICFLLFAGCDKCKYNNRNPVILDYSSITFSLYTITSNFQVKDFFAENSGYSPDSLRLFNINGKEIYLQRTPNKNEFTFYFMDEKMREKIFTNIIIQYYYLVFGYSDIDTMKLEMKGQYTGDCDNEAFELMRMYYNNKMVINAAAKGQTTFGFRYNKKI
jgi:hypothetical protein